MSRLTEQQHRVLTCLAGYARSDDPPTTRQLVAVLERTNAARRRYWSYDQVHSIMVRLESRGFVARTATRPARWQITDDGREKIAAVGREGLT